MTAGSASECDATPAWPGGSLLTKTSYGEPRRKAAVTATDVIDVAVALTAEQGLDHWTIRELTERLDAWPQAIYHHIGSREMVVHAVVERVVSSIPLPDPDLGWRSWFRELVFGMRPVLRAHRGVARRLAVHGPGVASALPIIDQGIRKLLDAGLGEQEATAAYAVLLNGGLMPLVVDDESARRGVQADGPDLQALVARADGGPGAPPGEGEGLRVFAASLGRLNDSEVSRVAFAEQFYAYTVERILDGVAVRIEAVREAGSM